VSAPTHGYTKLGHPVHGDTLHYLGDVLSLRRFARSWSVVTGVNAKLALAITLGVGTMWCAYLFAGIAFVSFPQAVKAFEQGKTIEGISWISQTFFQLVLLPIIIVGQNLQNIAGERRASKTFEDVEALREATKTTLDRLDVNTAGGLKVVMDKLDAIEAKLPK
jgi:hypothetical protein